jgi:hypothetical protein
MQIGGKGIKNLHVNMVLEKKILKNTNLERYLFIWKWLKQKIVWTIHFMTTSYGIKIYSTYANSNESLSLKFDNLFMNDLINNKDRFPYPFWYGKSQNSGKSKLTFPK